VVEASEARAAADEAWTLLLERQLQADVHAQAPDRATEVARLYGEKVLSLCGNPYGLRADQVFDDGAWPDLRADNCFMNHADSACVFDMQALMNRLSMDDIGYQLCLLTGLSTRLGSKADLSADYVNDWIDQIKQDTHQFYAGGWSSILPKSGDEWFGALNLGIVQAVGDYYECEQAAGEPDKSCRLNDLYDLKNYEPSQTEDEQAFLDSRKQCQGIFGAQVSIEQQAAEDPALNNPDCYQGSIGELALAARAAARDVDAANSALQDYTETYKAMAWKCTIDDRALEMTQAVTDQLDAITERLNSYTSTSRFLSETCKEVIGIGSMFIGIQKGEAYPMDVGDKVNSIFDMMVGGPLLKFQDQMLGIDEIQGMHDAFMADIQDEIADAKCFHDAEMSLIGANTQARRIEKAKLDLSHAILQMRNAQTEVARLISEGRHRLAAEQNRQRTSLYDDVWSDLWEGARQDYQGKVETYRRKMRLAQRMTYLALRAGEYEMQIPAAQAEALKRQVLTAREPGALDGVITQLDSIVSAGNIAGQQAGNRHVELSLRDNLLQLSDRSDLSAGLNTMSEVDRFQTLLASPAFAVYNDDGSYRGQLIPFSVAPLGVIGLGDPGSISLLNGTECAERNWAVSLAIQGQSLTDDASSYVQVGVLQKNNFYSQWCQTPGAGQGDVQAAAVRPARNLFQDPEWGGSYGATAPRDSEYVIALVDAYFNVSWEDFQRTEYREGSQETLACRGLYGEYALFFPAEKLSTFDGPGLRLNHIDDIWLRFDYVSAAKQW
jgi:hypothetical protein